MLSPKNMNEKEQLHYDGSQILLVLFGIGVAAELLIVLASLVSICVHPAAQTVVSDTGTGLQFDLLLGHANLSAEYLPTDYAAVNGKLFAVTYLLLGIIADKLPRFFILIIAGRMLERIGKSYSPFIPEVADDIRWVGRITICVGLFRKLILQTGISILVYRQVYFNNPIDFMWVLVGLIILLVGDIFRRGCILQKDADETL